MPYRKISYLGFILLLLCAGCGLKEGVVQKAPQSFFWFTGNTQDAVVYIDDLAPIMLNGHGSAENAEDENNTNRTGQVYYGISPGKHTIVIKKSGEVVVNRSVLLGDGITREIQIP